MALTPNNKFGASLLELRDLFRRYQRFAQVKAFKLLELCNWCYVRDLSAIEVEPFKALETATSHPLLNFR